MKRAAVFIEVDSGIGICKLHTGKTCADTVSRNDMRLKAYADDQAH